MVIRFSSSHNNGLLGLHTGLLSFQGKKNQDKKRLSLLVLGLLLASMAIISLFIPVRSQKVPPPNPYGQASIISVYCVLYINHSRSCDSNNNLPAAINIMYFLYKIRFVFTFGSAVMSPCPCISFRDIPGQGIEMHARTASWASLLPPELRENSLSAHCYTLTRSDIDPTPPGCFHL